MSNSKDCITLGKIVNLVIILKKQKNKNKINPEFPLNLRASLVVYLVYTKFIFAINVNLLVAFDKLLVARCDWHFTTGTLTTWHHPHGS